MAKVHEVMSTRVITMSPDVTIEEAIRMLLENRISGAPVIDRHNHLVGVVSEYRLMEVICNPDVKRELVSEVMTRNVMTVTEQTDLTEVANKFLVHRIRRMPVVRGRQLVGVISRSDILKCAVSESRIPGSPSAGSKSLATV